MKSGAIASWLIVVAAGSFVNTVNETTSNAPSTSVRLDKISTGIRREARSAITVATTPAARNTHAVNIVRRMNSFSIVRKSANGATRTNNNPTIARSSDLRRAAAAGFGGVSVMLLGILPRLAHPCTTPANPTSLEPTPRPATLAP